MDVNNQMNNMMGMMGNNMGMGMADMMNPMMNFMNMQQQQVQFLDPLKKKNIFLLFSRGWWGMDLSRTRAVMQKDLFTKFVMEKKYS